MLVKNLLIQSSKITSRQSFAYSTRSYSSIHINTMNIMLGSKRSYTLTQDMNGPNTIKTTSSTSTSIKSGKKNETKPYPVVSSDNEDIETVAGHTRV